MRRPRFVARMGAAARVGTIAALSATGLTLGGIASAATMSPLPAYVWTGASDHACNGDCTMAWFDALLNPEQRAAFEAARYGRPHADPIDTRGMRVAVMSYAAGGDPFVTRREGYIAADAAGDAYGWRIAQDTWVVRLEDCRNWALVTRTPEVPTTPSLTAGGAPGAGGVPVIPVRPGATAGIGTPTLAGFSLSPPGGTPLTDLVEPPARTPGEVFPPLANLPPPAAPPIPAVPLPAGLWLMLSAFAILAGTALRRRAA